MCQKLGESVTSPITAAVPGIGMSSDGIATTNAICNRTDCPSYGKWWCPFTGW